MLRYVTVVQGSLVEITAQFTSLASKRKILECETSQCLQTRTIFGITQQRACMSTSGITARHCSRLSISELVVTHTKALDSLLTGPRIKSDAC